jgi:uncharacterized Zn finger protein
MPHEIEDVFAECGTPLFPRSATDLDMHCSCPDWGVPCKHLAAVCYVLAEEFDRDPFAMLAWRGQARDDLLAALRKIQAPRSGPAAGASAVAPGGGAALSRAAALHLDEAAAPLPGSPADFWSARLSPARLRALSAPADSPAPDLLLRMFPPPSVPVRGRDLAEILTPAYHRLAVGDHEPEQSEGD